MSGFGFGDIPFLSNATPPAASGTVATFLGTSVVTSGFPPRNHTAPVSLSAGQKYLIAMARSGTDGSPYTLTVNGTAASQVVASVDDDGVGVVFYEVTPASSGTGAVITYSGGGPLRSILGYWEVPNAATVQASLGTTATTGTDRVVSVNTDAGDAVVAAMASQASSPTITWSGLTEETGGSAADTGFVASFAGADDVAAATPRAITGTSSDANNNNGKGAAAVVIG